MTTIGCDDNIEKEDHCSSRATGTSDGDTGGDPQPMEEVREHESADKEQVPDNRVEDKVSNTGTVHQQQQRPGAHTPPAISDNMKDNAAKRVTLPSNVTTKYTLVPLQDIPSSCKQQRRQK
eukprot:GHVU01198880.1.p1 GENE.GHVU01198880.1~~GHVU01198880.1.p1  ORF type:complete len:136 (-),score=24.67 GHVU01198880.1:625-987(-)